MMEHPWGGDLVLSVPQIDREHEVAIACANEFCNSVEAGGSRAELEARLTRVVEVFELHFRSEEGLMSSRGFPGRERHAEEHRKLLGQIGGLRDDLGAGSVSLCDALAKFVRLWTEQHILGPDAGFAQFLLHDERIEVPSQTQP